ncbi:MAG TPA: acyl-CoA thioesterase domain-containing protein, partial [Solirubrobacteraceae bacterium]|nr:acyl-CoA thioesterase domain-containing protein [Solirubrobacteraceae bacterium]
MSESIFTREDAAEGSSGSTLEESPASARIGDGTYTPTEHASGPWDPRALHGGAPAALITSAFEQFDPGTELRVARLSFEFLRPVPMAPLRLSTQVLRP